MLCPQVAQSGASVRLGAKRPDLKHGEWSGLARWRRNAATTDLGLSGRIDRLCVGSSTRLKRVEPALQIIDLLLAPELICPQLFELLAKLKKCIAFGRLRVCLDGRNETDKRGGRDCSRDRNRRYSPRLTRAMRISRAFTITPKRATVIIISDAISTFYFVVLAALAALASAAAFAASSCVFCGLNSSQSVNGSGSPVSCNPTTAW